MIVVIAIAVAIVFLVLAVLVKRSQVFASFEVRKLKLPAQNLTYTTYLGDYKALGTLFQTIADDLKRFNADGQYTLFGVYYDNPSNLVDIKQGRAIVGVVDVPEAFLSSPNNTLTYKTVRHGQLEAIGAIFPLHGMATMLSAIIRGYKAIKAHGVKEGLFSVDTDCNVDIGYSMELYEWQQHRLTISFPYGNEAKKLWNLSGRPQPPYKRAISAKTEL